MRSSQFPASRGSWCKKQAALADIANRANACRAKTLAGTRAVHPSKTEFHLPMSGGRPSAFTHRQKGLAVRTDGENNATAKMEYSCHAHTAEDIADGTYILEPPLPPSPTDFVSWSPEPRRHPRQARVVAHVRGAIRLAVLLDAHVTQELLSFERGRKDSSPSRNSRKLAPGHGAGRPVLRYGAGAVWALPWLRNSRLGSQARPGLHAYRKFHDRSPRYRVRDIEALSRQNP